MGAGLDTRPRGAATTLPAPCTFQLIAYLEQMQHLMPVKDAPRAPAAHCPSPNLPQAVQRGSCGCLAYILSPVSHTLDPLPEASCLNTLEASL